MANLDDELSLFMNEIEKVEVEVKKELESGEKASLETSERCRELFQMRASAVQHAKDSLADIDAPISI